MIIILEISSCFLTISYSSLIRLVSGAKTNMSLWFSLISTNESFLQEQTLGLVHHDRYHGSWYMASRYISGFMIHDITFDFQLGEIGQRSWWWRDLVFWSSCYLLSQQLEGLPHIFDWHLELDWNLDKFGQIHFKTQASLERMRVLYKGREGIVNIREAVFTQREKRSPCFQ